MLKRLLVLSLLWCPFLWADTSTSDSTLSIAPSATSGTTITAADENDRNSDITTWANAHTHDLANSTSFGDGTAGNKSFCADAADATDSCIRFEDATGIWSIDTPIAGSYNGILVSSGSTGLTANALVLGTGVGNVLDDLITLAGTRPATYGDVSARAYNSGAFALTSGTAAVITLDSERWDTDTIHSTSSNTSRLTATTAGKYHITGHVEFAATGASGQRRLEIYLNGATVIASQDCDDSPFDPSQTVRCSVTTHYNLAAADYVELRATQRAVSSLNINASGNYSPEFEMVKVP